VNVDDELQVLVVAPRTFEDAPEEGELRRGEGGLSWLLVIDSNLMLPLPQAPDQLMGAATPAADLYALGCTLLFLISSQWPGAFPRQGMKIIYKWVCVPSWCMYEHIA